MPDDHTSTLLAAYRDELSAGHAAMKSRDFTEAFRRYERAHILGQRRTGLHVRAHVAMLRVAWKKGDMKELMGQVTRIAAAALFSRIWVPEGNTGGANVSALKPMPIPEDLRRFFT